VLIPSWNGHLDLLSVQPSDFCTPAARCGLEWLDAEILLGRGAHLSLLIFDRWRSLIDGMRNISKRIPSLGALLRAEAARAETELAWRGLHASG
jgi:hypothetical protein